MVYHSFSCTFVHLILKITLFNIKIFISKMEKQKLRKVKELAQSLTSNYRQSQDSGLELKLKSHTIPSSDDSNQAGTGLGHTQQLSSKESNCVMGTVSLISQPFRREARNYSISILQQLFSFSSH